METILKYLNRTDWFLAFACLAYGVFTLDWRFLVAGLFSLCVAWFNPSRRMKQWLEKKLLASPKRRKEAAARASAVRIAEEEARYAASQAVPQHAADFRQQVQGYGPLRIGPSKHNCLRPGAANLAGRPLKTWF